MSLVNDALKRARGAQPAAPPPIADGQFKPAECAPAHSSLWCGMLVPVLMLGAALMALLMAYEIYHARNQERVSEARAREMSTNGAAQVAAAPQPQVIVRPEPVMTVVPEAPVVAPAPVVQPVVPAPEPLRLQAVVYHPTRASVIINGKSLFKGDRFGDWLVREIQTGSVVLTSPMATNTLVLNN